MTQQHIKYLAFASKQCWDVIFSL